MEEVNIYLGKQPALLQEEYKREMPTTDNIREAIVRHPSRFELVDTPSHPGESEQWILRNDSVIVTLDTGLATGGDDVCNSSCQSRSTMETAATSDQAESTQADARQGFAHSGWVANCVSDLASCD
jgi:hypothetical protein